MGPSVGTSVVHPVMVTAHLEATIAYYCDVLGFVEATPFRHDSGLLERLGAGSAPVADAVILKAPGGGEIELVHFVEPSTLHVEQRLEWQWAGIRSVTYRVDDLEAVLLRVAEAGYSRLGEVVTVPDANLGGDIRVVYVTAPDNVIVTLVG